MRIMSQMLESDERIRAVAAYVASLDYQPGDE
jgi:cytochrome c553